MQEFSFNLNKIYQSVIDQINIEFDQITDLRSKAFDLNSNISIVESSVALAQNYGCR